MEAGSGFFFTIKDQHPWVVLSNPKVNKDSVLIVNLTSWQEYKEQTCIIERGEHLCVTKKSCAYYEGATLAKLDALLKAKDGGVLKLEREPMQTQVLSRMLDGAAKSDNLSLGAKDLLRQQKLIQ